MSDTDSQLGFAPGSTSSKVSGPGSDPINVRTTRINHLILGLPEATSKVARPVGEALSREGLLDALTLLFDECDKELLKKKHRPVFDFVHRYRDVIREANRLRVGLADFTTKDLIAKGHFGEVHLVAENSTKDLYAIKKISKTATITAAQMKQERDIMAYKTSDWLISLQYAFQDADHLYLVMEYMPGGDLFSLMIRTGAFDEELARFYLAELTLALHALHRQGYAHRDIKPENILLDRFGHLKLADFGSAVALSKNGTFISPSPVGTPNYIAPELLDALSSSGPAAMHDATCDFWSMGVIGYELLCEQTPFDRAEPVDTYAAIQAHGSADAKELSFPAALSVSAAFVSLIRGLCVRRAKRLTYPKIRQHAFFKDTDWEGVRHRVPPIIPSLSYEEDTSNFEDPERKAALLCSGNSEKLANARETEAAVLAKPRSRDFSGANLPFVGYSYVAEAQLGTAASTTDVADASLGGSAGSRLSMLGGGGGGGRQPADAERQLRELRRTIEKQAAELRQLSAEELRRSDSKERLERLLRDSQDELDRRKEELRTRTADLSAARMDVKTLRSSLRIEEEARSKRDANITQVLNATYQKWENARRLQEAGFEKRIAQKCTEIAAMTEQMLVHEQEMRAKGGECQRLEERMRTARDSLRTARDKNETDRQAAAKEAAEQLALAETRVRQLRAALQREEEAKVGAQAELLALRRDLNESVSSAQSAEQSRVVADRNADEVGRRLRELLLENQALRAENAAAARSAGDLQRRLEESVREAVRVRQEQQQQQDLQVAELCKQRDLAAEAAAAAAVSRRSSCGANSDRFRSAQGSLESLETSVCCESACSAQQFDQMRSDLAVAKAAENEQRARAERMEEAVTRLELAIGRLQPKSQDALLERQNSKLEDQLTSVREQAIVERQASRSAHLSLYKLEKQLELEVEEKKRALRRAELSDERVTKLRIEREEVERQVRDKTATIAGREERIAELSAAVTELKADAKQQLDVWRRSEEERTALKSAVFEKTHSCYQAEQTATALRCERDHLQQCLRDAGAELKRALEERDEAQQRLSHTSEKCAQLEAKLKEGQQNIKLLKYASTTMEENIIEMDDQLDRERQEVRDQKLRIRELEASGERYVGELQAWRQKHDAALAERQLVDSRCLELETRVQEERERCDEQCRQLMAAAEQVAELQRTDNEQLLAIDQYQTDIRCVQLAQQCYGDELVALKEENSRLLSDLYRAKDEVQRQTVAAEQERAEAAAEAGELHTAVDALRGTLEERLCYYKHREIKADATQAQLKKLVEYLQERVYDLQQKQPKKTRLAELFKSSTGKGKENVPQRGAAAAGVGMDEVQSATMTLASREALVAKMRTVKGELQRERERSARLKEQLIQAKTIVQRAGLGERTTAAVFPEDSADAADAADDDVFAAAAPAVLATPQTARQPSAPTVAEVYQREEPAPIVGDRLVSPRQPAATRTEHRFEMTVETAAPDAAAAADPAASIFLTCIACRTQINVERSYMRCRECKSCVHRKCRDAVSSSCEAEELRRMQHVQQRRGSERESLGLPGKHADDVEDPRVTEALDAVLAAAAPQAAAGGDGGGVQPSAAAAGQVYGGEVVLRSAELSPPVSVNCVLEMQEGVLLLGTESGLYSYHTRTGQLVHIPPIANVSALIASPALSKCLLIGDTGRRLYFCDWRHLQSRAAASACLKPRLDCSTIDLPFANRVPTERWHHISVYEPPPQDGTATTISSSSSGQSPTTMDAHVIACTSSRLVILRFDAAHNRFKPVCALDTAKPVTGVLFTAYTAIVSSDKFFEIDLKSFQAEEFLDESDASCVEARSSGRPHAAFKVNSQEFLLCFAEFGVFVDTYGDRSRPDNLRWSAPEPRDFVYRDPLLFVAFPGWVEVVRVNKSYSGGGGGEVRAMRAVVVMQEPRLCGASGAHGAFVLQAMVGTAGGTVGSELVALDGLAALRTSVGGGGGGGGSTETLLSSVTAPGGTLRGSCETLSTIGNGLDSL